MADVLSVILWLLRLYGPLALFLFTFLEASMLFPFLPSEVVVPAAAALLITDLSSFLLFVTAAAVGGTIGAFVPFYVFHHIQVGKTDRFRSYLKISDEHIEWGKAWFLRWGQSSVLWGRFLPGLRSVISIPAGLAGMNPIRFGGYTAAGTVGFYAAAGGVVYYGRQESLFEGVFTVATRRPSLVGAALLVLLGTGFVVWYWSYRRA